MLAPLSDRRVSLSVSSPPGNEKSLWSVQLCIYVGKEGHEVFISHYLTYAKMQRAVLFSLLLFSF